MFKIKNEVIKKAKSYIGHEEKSGNSGFKEEGFERLMRAMGWKKYQSWCAYVAEAIWKESYKEIDATDIVNRFDKLFSSSATKTFKNFKKAGYPTGLTPKKGALVIWQLYQNGVPNWKGHIGVVTDVKHSAGRFKSVEGNTNKGMSRNGYIVWEHDHVTIEEKKRTNGLKLIGFIYLTDYITPENVKKTPAYGY